MSKPAADPYAYFFQLAFSTTHKGKRVVGLVLQGRFYTLPDAVDDARIDYRCDRKTGIAVEYSVDGCKTWKLIPTNFFRL